MGYDRPADAPPLPDRELWAAALHVQRLFGADAPLHVANRIGALALAGDAAGIEVWKAIARRLDQLVHGERFPQ